MMWNCAECCYGKRTSLLRQLCHKLVQVLVNHQTSALLCFPQKSHPLSQPYHLVRVMSNNEHDLDAPGMSAGGTAENESFQADSVSQSSDMEQGWPGEEEEKQLYHGTAEEKTSSQVDLAMLTLCMGGFVFPSLPPFSPQPRLTIGSLQMAFSIQFVAGTVRLPLQIGFLFLSTETEFNNGVRPQPRIPFLRWRSARRL